MRNGKENDGEENVPVSFLDVIHVPEDSAEKLFPENLGGDAVLGRETPEVPDSIPFVRIRNLNRCEDEDPRPKPSVEIGWKWSF